MPMNNSDTQIAPKWPSSNERLRTGLPDSGERQQFATGAVRDSDAGKSRLELISPLFLDRMGRHLAAGAAKYSARNWEQGISIERCLASLKRHLNQFMLGEQDEDHLAAVACNTMFIIHFQAMINRGRLPASLDDLPDYTPAPTIGETSDDTDDQD